ncbi:MAG: V4R domain-containing protein [Candidatus Methylomirabilales bacterium]
MEESIEKGLVLSAIAALKSVGGDTLVSILFGADDPFSPANIERLPERIPLVEFLRLRDQAIDLLGQSFAGTALQAGREMVKHIPAEKTAFLEQLIRTSRHTLGDLGILGQVALLASQGNPGTVRPSVDREGLLLRLENCPECRALRWGTPFCFINQGILTEFARRYLNLAVSTTETQCMAMGAPFCAIRITPATTP